MKYNTLKFLYIILFMLLISCGGVSNETPKETTEAYVFEKLVGPDIWTTITNKIAIDSTENIYLTNGTTIFRVTNGIPEIYITQQEIVTSLGSAFFAFIEIADIRVGPDDNLYILEKNSRRILSATGLGIVSIHRDISDIPGFPHLIGLEDSDRISLINLYDGLWSITPAGNTLLYDSNLVLGGNNCGSESLAISRTGHFAYLPGCNLDPLVGGYLDGSGVGILAEETDFNLGSTMGFSSIGSDPSGGYIVSLDGPIVKIFEDGTWESLPLEKDLSELGVAMEDNYMAFWQRPIAISTTKTIYICTNTTLYSAHKISIPN